MRTPKRPDETGPTVELTLIGAGLFLIGLARLLRAGDDNLADLGD